MLRSLTNKFVAIVCCSVLLSLSTSPMVAAQRVKVPAGQLVPIVFKTPINSDSLTKGDVVPVSIGQDVKVKGRIVFKGGTDGVAYIDDVKRSGHHGRAGFISIREARISDISGNTHSIQLNTMAKGEGHRPSAILLSVVGVGLTLIPFGIWRTGEPALLSGAKIHQGFMSSPCEVYVH